MLLHDVQNVRVVGQSGQSVCELECSVPLFMVKLLQVDECEQVELGHEMVVLDDEFSIVWLAVNDIVKHGYFFVLELGHKWHPLTASLPLALLLECLAVHVVSIRKVVSKGVVLVRQNASVLRLALKMAVCSLLMAVERHILWA